MKNLILSIAVAITVISCGVFGSLTSNTSIKPNESFVLGNNAHSNFKVKLKNASNHDHEVYFAPIAGGTHSRQILQPNQEIVLKAESNTAVIIQNKSDQSASVDLHATGDLGLSMGYKN